MIGMPMTVGKSLFEKLARETMIREGSGLAGPKMEFIGFDEIGSADFVGLRGLVDGVTVEGTEIVIMDAKTSSRNDQLNAIREVIHIRSRPEVAEPVYTGPLGRRNKSDRKRDKRNRWR